MLQKLKTVFRYDDSEMPLLEHLEAFRKMVVRSVLVILIGMAACAYFVPWMTNMLCAPAQEYIDSGQIMLQLPEPTSGFKLWFLLAFWGGVLVSMPALMLIIGSFILPGVKHSERKIFQRVAGFSGLLFVAGVVMSYFWTLPVAMKVLFGFGHKLGGNAIWHYPKYISFTLQVLLGFGVAFQMPILIILLGKLGFLNSKQLKTKRRHVAVGIFVLAMLLTPPDITTQFLMAVPLIILYEFCIWFLYFTEGKEKRLTVEKETEKPSKEDSPDSESNK